MCKFGMLLLLVWYKQQCKRQKKLVTMQTTKETCYNANDKRNLLQCKRQKKQGKGIALFNLLCAML